MNVAHQAIDLKNPKSNYNKTPGYTQDEIDGMNNFIQSGFTDTYRHFYPDTIKYFGGVIDLIQELKNIGWN